MPLVDLPVSEVEVHLYALGEIWLEEHHREIISLDDEEMEPRIYTELREHLTERARSMLQSEPHARVTHVALDIAGDLRQQIVALRRGRPALEPIGSLCEATKQAEDPDLRLLG